MFNLNSDGIKSEFHMNFASRLVDATGLVLNLSFNDASESPAVPLSQHHPPTGTLPVLNLHFWQIPKLSHPRHSLPHEEIKNAELLQKERDDALERIKQLEVLWMCDMRIRSASIMMCRASYWKSMISMPHHGISNANACSFDHSLICTWKFTR